MLEHASRLTAWDQRLLERHLAFYQSLHHGERAPTTAAQEQFVRVCQGEMSPRTQHEIAYRRYLDLAAEGSVSAVQPASADPLTSDTAAHPGEDTTLLDRAIAVVGDLEKLQFRVSLPERRALIGSIAGLYRKGIATCRSVGSDASAWAIALLSDPSLSRELERWTGQMWGGLSDAYTKAMDGSYLEGLRGDGVHQPSDHRLLLEGHDLSSSWNAVRDALPTDTITDEVIGWLKALASDVVTPAGLPVCTVAPEQYETLRCLAQHFSIPEQWLRDALSYTGVELVSGMLPGIALAMNWNRAEAVEFAKLVGSLGVGAAISANPITAAVAVAVFARGFHKARHGAAPADWAMGMAEGGAMTGAVLAMSAAVGGPAVVGVMAGIGLAAGMSHLRKSGHLAEVGGWLQGMLGSGAAGTGRSAAPAVGQ